MQPPEPFEPFDLRFESFVEFEAALRAATTALFPPGRADPHPLYTVRPSRCQFRNGADVIETADGELLQDEDGNYEYSLPLYKWIATVGGSAEFARKGSAEDRFPDDAALLQHVLTRVQKTADWELWDKCGDGYDATFTRAHGTVIKGYRLSSTRDKHGVVLLHVSLCPIRKPVNG